MTKLPCRDVGGHLLIPRVVCTMRKPFGKLGDLLLAQAFDRRLNFLDGAHVMSLAGVADAFNFGGFSG